jgi:hypothetical protein
MTDVGMKRIPRGKGYHNTGATIAAADYGGAELEGTVRSFGDFDIASVGEPAHRRSAGDVVCVLVRNVSGHVLLPKRLVNWAAGYRGKRVDGYTCTTGCEIAGVVDEHYSSSGVPIGELFWLCIKGHSEVMSPYTTDAAGASAGDFLFAVTATTSGNSTAGRWNRWIGTDTTTALEGTGLPQKYIRNELGRIATDLASASTDTAVLVEVNTHWYGG